MTIPLIDFSAADDPSCSADLSGDVHRAFVDDGFLMLKNTRMDPNLVSSVFAASRSFFTGPMTTKRACQYLSAQENFGYQGLGQENLDPSAPADLKETFTMRNILNVPIAEERWPSAEFKALMSAFYADALRVAQQLQSVLCNALELPGDYFSNCHTGENISLRLLYYPAIDAQRAAEMQATDGQMGAGAHTDYGLLTLLFQDNVGGLQVLGANQTWQNVDPVPQGIVVNSGDLLERWTNDRYCSTLHRVVPISGAHDRLSIAMFIDPDSNTEVSALNSCISIDKPATHAPITAGEHIQQKLEASHKNRFS